MARLSGKNQPYKRSARGFARAGAILQPRIRAVGEARGFAVARLLTHWAEIAGPDLAESTLPLKIGYGHRAFGATLTVLTTGTRAPILEMGKESLRERINACYGYSAISRIRIVQTGPVGFDGGKAEFRPSPEPRQAPERPEIRAAARSAAAHIGDGELREALESLGASILARNAELSKG